jgi:threonine-phosphate decarboxylase
MNPLSERPTELKSAQDEFLERSRHNPTYFEVVKNLGEVIDYCVPANPYFPTKAMFKSLSQALPDLLKYYPDHGPASVAILSELTGIDPSNLIAANGSTEIITFLINGQMPGPMVTEIPTFGRWTDLPIDIGKSLALYQRKSENRFAINPDELIAFTKKSGAKSLVICNPNNPTGSLSPKEDILKIVSGLGNLELIVIDESFMPFADDPSKDSLESIAAQLPNVVLVKSLGKALGWHGVRLGYGVANRSLMDKLRPHVPYWNINGIAAFALKLIRNHRQEFANSLSRVVCDRRYLEKCLAAMPGITIFESQGNFAFFQIPRRIDGVELRNRLATRHGIFVRECGNKIGSCRSFFRVAARPKEDTDSLIRALTSEIKSIKL